VLVVELLILLSSLLLMVVLVSASLGNMLTILSSGRLQPNHLLFPTWAVSTLAVLCIVARVIVSRIRGTRAPLKGAARFVVQTAVVVGIICALAVAYSAVLSAIEIERAPKPPVYTIALTAILVSILQLPYAFSRLKRLSPNPPMQRLGLRPTADRQPR